LSLSTTIGSRRLREARSRRWKVIAGDRRGESSPCPRVYYDDALLPASDSDALLNSDVVVVVGGAHSSLRRQTPVRAALIGVVARC